MTSIFERSIQSTAWNIGASLTGAVVLFGRSVLLSRWLPVATFGVYAKAMAVIALAAVLLSFGLNAAMLHRSPETQNEAHAAATHFTLTTIFTAVWLVIVLTGSYLFTKGNLRWALMVIAIATGLNNLTQTSRSILLRRIIHRRLALIQFITIFATTGIALFLAWRGVSLGALLATNVTTALIALFLHYLWRPVWRPQWRWQGPEIRYFLSFGSRTFLSSALIIALNKLDDLWTGAYLGDTALGFYGRAYTFATYPSRVLATPVNNVSGGTYAELKYERKQLSQAFFRTLALLIRTGFLLGGWLAFVAPEFVGLLLGNKWLPIITVFRLMLVFTLLDPIKGTIANLFIAVGKPESIIQVRLIQLVILVMGLFLFGTRWGIIGVAFAVDIMLFMGILLLLWKSRRYVTLSIRKAFLVPTLALSGAFLAGYGTLRILGMSEATWGSAMLKTAIFLLIYLLVLFLGEREQVAGMMKMLHTSLTRRKASAAQ
jgi:O-antigen/teichoic acid export membrane protein